VLIKR